MDTVVTLRTKGEALATRLHDGYRKIETAQANGQDVSAWEAFWVDLLREYEAVCDELVSATRGQAAAR